jgi:hypothetical protein
MGVGTWMSPVHLNHSFRLEQFCQMETTLPSVNLTTFSCKRFIILCDEVKSPVLRTSCRGGNSSLPPAQDPGA